MPKHALWKPTADEVAFIKAHPLPLPGDAVQTWAMGFLSVKLKPRTAVGATRINTPPQLPIHLVIVTSPDDQLEQAVADLLQTATHHLLEILATVSPGVF